MDSFKDSVISVGRDRFALELREAPPAGFGEAFSRLIAADPILEAFQISLDGQRVSFHGDRKGTRDALDQKVKMAMDNCEHEAEIRRESHRLDEEQRKAAVDKFNQNNPPPRELT